MAWVARVDVEEIPTSLSLSLIPGSLLPSLDLGETSSEQHSGGQDVADTRCVRAVKIPGPLRMQKRVQPAVTGSEVRNP